MINKTLFLNFAYSRSIVLSVSEAKLMIVKKISLIRLGHINFTIFALIAVVKKKIPKIQRIISNLLTLIH